MPESSGVLYEGRACEKHAQECGDRPVCLQGLDVPRGLSTPFLRGPCGLGLYGRIKRDGGSVGTRRKVTVNPGGSTV